jgi:hypothetical protein
LLFSVIIPTFNRAALLPQTLDSVFAQTFKDFELIVVDDGSTDTTVDFLSSLGDQIRLVRHENRGPGAARNSGSKNATGDYLAFLDSDDVWFPWTLDVYRRAIHHGANPALVAGFGTPMAAESMPQRPLSLAYLPNLLKACTGPMPPVGGTPSVAVRADVFERIGGFSELRINGEDVDLWLRLGAEPGFVRILEPPLFQQRRHTTSINNNHVAQVAGAKFLVTRELTGSYPGGRTFHIARRRILAAMARSISLECVMAGDFRNAFWLVQHTLRWQLRLGRAKFLFGFPVLASSAYIKQRVLK